MSEEFIKTLKAYIDAYDEYQRQKTAIAQYSGEMAAFLRTLSGLSIRKFAIELGVSYAYLSKVERGREPLSPDLARRMLEKVKYNG